MSTEPRASATSSTPSRWWRPRRFLLGSIETLLMRAAFAYLIYDSVQWQTGNLDEQKFPNGLAHWFDLTWLGDHPPGAWTLRFSIAGLALFVIGILPALGLLPIVFYAIIIGTLLNSQGAINHSWQLVTMLALAQLLVYAWPRSRNLKTNLRICCRPDTERHRQAVHAALVIIAASYVVCGVMKIVNSDGLWLYKAPNLAVQLHKTHLAHYFNTLNHPPEWLHDFTNLLLTHPNLARLLFGSGFFIELTAFILLINRRFACIGGLLIIAMHLSISHLMNLNFEEHIAVVIIYAVNIPGILKTWRGAP